MRFLSFFSAISLLFFFSVAGEEAGLLLDESFDAGSDGWTMSDPAAWKISEVDGNPVLENMGNSQFEPPYRSPLNLALKDGLYVGDFVLTARVRSLQEPRAHRDMCLFFGYQNSSNFYYVHLGQEADPHANQIFLVNEAPRVAISEIASDGSDWAAADWHDVKIVREVSSGLIEIYFDDMETPSHVAHDKTFTWGQIGIGTFDDMGLWDDIRVEGVAVEKPDTTMPDPKSLKFTKWTPDFEVPDPVAISFDEKGGAYVTQTRRRKANDLDIRRNYDFLEDDLRFTSTEDKENFYREQFVPENSAQNAKRVEDYNGDGVHDIADLTALSERIHYIADEDGDGFAETIVTYAEDLDHLIGGVAGGVLYLDGDVYVSPVPEVVKFRDTDGDRQADERSIVASGFGVHLAYAGHDMHGLSVGPDGRIYWSIGDKGIRVKTADGYDYKFPSQGGLMRCEPDGSNFEIYAHGQRNIQEVAFDQHGNFFGVDNDADFEGEKERFVYIEQYLDSGWRSNWQYLRDDYNSWNDDRMHLPYHEGQPRWFTPPLGNYENGPAGFKFNPGTALGPEYQNYFFLTSAPRGEQWAFQVEPKGDAFTMVRDHKISEGVALVGLNFAPDGALYGVDWGGGYPLNEKGAVWKIDVESGTGHPLREETQGLIAADFAEKKEDELSQLLAHADQRVRLKAQFEFANRGEVAPFSALAEDHGGDQLARIHSIWGIGQLIRKEEADASALVGLLDDPDPEIRAQVLRTVSDPFGRSLGLDRIPAPDGTTNPLTRFLLPLLDDPSQRVRMQALLALARTQDLAASTAVVNFVIRKELDPAMVYSRHAATIALAGTVSTDQLAAMAEHQSAFARTCAVIALRKRGAPEVQVFLADPDPVIAADAARAIHDDWMIPEALPALASMLGAEGADEAFTRRAINANFRLGDVDSAERVVAFLADDSRDESRLLPALAALESWLVPGNLDLVVGRYRPLEKRDEAILAAPLAKHLDRLLLSDYSSVRGGAMELARQVDLEIKSETLLTVAQNTDFDGALRSEALQTLAAQEAADLKEIVTALLKDPAPEVQRTALELLLPLDPATAESEIRERIEGDAAMTVRQHAILQLTALESTDILVGLLEMWKAGDLAQELQLEVYEVATDPAFANDATIPEFVDQASAVWTAAATNDPLAPFEFASVGGDPVAGRVVFMNNAAALCVQCHKVADGSGSNVGPNLKEIGAKKDTRYLLESLIMPQTVVAKGYGMISVTLQDGSTIAGQFRSEKDGVVKIRDANNETTAIPVDDIAERTPVISTMPPVGHILKKRELRDVMAYLQSLKG